jgi:hypothetical protein
MIPLQPFKGRRFFGVVAICHCSGKRRATPARGPRDGVFGLPRLKDKML